MCLNFLNINSSILGEENYDVLSGFPVAAPVKGEPKETLVLEKDSAEVADLTFDPTNASDNTEESKVYSYIAKYVLLYDIAQKVNKSFLHSAYILKL